MDENNGMVAISTFHNVDLLTGIVTDFEQKKKIIVQVTLKQ